MDILETERLILRPWKATDSKDFFEYAKSPTLGPQAGWKPHADEAESKKVIFDFIRVKDTWAIELKAEKKVIGSISLHAPIHSEIQYDVELGYVVSQAYQNRGYATEACQRMVRYAFEYYMIRNLMSCHIDGNNSSKRVLEKCGFRYLKHFEHFLKRWDGIRVNAEVFMMNIVDFERNYKR